MKKYGFAFAAIGLAGLSLAFQATGKTEIVSLPKTAADSRNGCPAGAGSSGRAGRPRLHRRPAGRPSRRSRETGCLIERKPNASLRPTRRPIPRFWPLRSERSIPTRSWRMIWLPWKPQFPDWPGRHDRNKPGKPGDPGPESQRQPESEEDEAGRAFPRLPPRPGMDLGRGPLSSWPNIFWKITHPIPEVRRLVDSAEIWVVPMVNPDGHDYSVRVYRYWRKNRRANDDGSFGVDPNRNYGFAWGL